MTMFDKNDGERYTIEIVLTATLAVGGERCSYTLSQIAHH